MQGTIVGSLAKDDLVDLLDTSDNEQWLKVQKEELVGWSSQKYLAPYSPQAAGGPVDDILEIARGSAIATYDWPGRGVAPRGYTKGMALAYARAYCKLRGGDAYAQEMAKASTGNGATDALAYFAARFQQLGMDNEGSGVATLRHLFVLMLGLGMRESSGRWCEGRDQSADNLTGETAEAGLFQTSWDARSASPLLPQLFNDYRAKPDGFLEVFQEGVTSKPADLENFGAGNGKEFQRLSKQCPDFAAEFAAVALRNIRSHWGPINTRAAELRPEAERMFLRVEQAVDTSGACASLL